MNTRHLYRSREDKKLTGLCGGIADFLGIDSTLLRIGVVLVTIFAGGLPILLYFLVAMLVPKEPLATKTERFFDPMDTGSSVNHLDDEIAWLEKRALQQEVSRLRAELAKYK